ISGYRSDQLLKLIKEPDSQNSLKEADLVLMTIGANDMMKVFKRDFSHLKVEPFFNELNDFKKRLADIFKEIHAINSDIKVYLIVISENDMMKVFKRDFSHLKVEPFFNELNDFKKRLADIFKEIHAINSDAKIYLIGFYDPFSEYFPEIEELSYISSSWSTET